MSSLKKVLLVFCLVIIIGGETIYILLYIMFIWKLLQTQSTLNSPPATVTELVQDFKPSRARGQGIELNGEYFPAEKTLFTLWMSPALQEQQQGVSEEKQQ